MIKDFLIYCWERQRFASIIWILNLLFILTLFVLMIALPQGHPFWKSPVINLLLTIFWSHTIGYAVFTVLK